MKKMKESQRKTPKITNIELARHDIVDDLGKEIDIILKALGHSEALVTDESWVSDFLPFLSSMDREKAFKNFKKKMAKIGIKVCFHDSIIDIAKRIKGD